jgi:perosamine synthetase
MEDKLAFLDGQRAVKMDIGDMFSWPIVTKEHEEAVLKVLRAGEMSGLDVTHEFEAGYARDLGMKYALACNNGTAAIHCGFYGLGIGVGDEVICPSLTFWASIMPVYSLGASPVFADVDRQTLCITAEEIEKRVTDRTKAVVVVHYGAMPADMDSIMAVARKHNLLVFEDCSHAHGCLYKGKDVGTFGDAAGFSLMSGKSFAIGEGGILFTNNQDVYERAILFGHYAQHGKIETSEIKQYVGLPCGGYKYRMHQLTSAFGLVQLKYYKQQFVEIDKAMNCFCDLMEGVPGLTPIRPEKKSGSTKGGWYQPLMHYAPEAFGGLSVHRFADAVRAEGADCSAGCNKPLHPHRVFSDMDIYGHGKPTRIARLGSNAEMPQNGDLEVTQSINDRILLIPWFKHCRPEIIREHAEAYKKVARNYEALLKNDDHVVTSGGYGSTFR